MRIGSYQVLLELARGGMGKVYLARTLGPGGVERLVAIKRAHEHLLGTSRAVADRFLDEARIAAHVHHSNVIGVHQAGSDEDGYYLVLDYVEGESLQGLLEAAQVRGRRVPPQIVLRVVCDALSGLHAAHEATDAHGRALGILHRDVSTQNLLVGRDGVTRLTDFGIAKSALSMVVTDEHYVQGKLVYMAPEYLRRKPVDRTLDVYAMGMTLWIALTGDAPWPEAEEAQLLHAILVTGVPSLSGAAVELGPEIAGVVDRACHLDARERFPTARALLDALEKASESIGGLARPVEVAEFVDELVGKDLAARRELTKSRRDAMDVEGTAGAATDTPAAAAAPVEARAEGTERRERADGWAPDEQRLPTEALRRGWEEPRPWRGVLYATIVAVVLIAVIVAARRGSRTSDESGPRAIPAASRGTTEPTPTAEPIAPAGSTTATGRVFAVPAGATASSGARPTSPAPSPNPRRGPRGPGRPEASAVAPFSTANPYR